MREVNSAEFFKVIGPQNVHPHIEGSFPYTSIFQTPQRVEVGRIVDKFADGKGYPIEKTYWLK